MVGMARKTAAQLDREIAESLAATSGAGLYDPKRLKAVSRAAKHEKRKEIQARFPIGTHVKGTRRAFAFEGAVGKVTGYDLGMDEDAPRVKVRLLAPVKYMGRDVRVWTFDAEAIVAVTRDQLAVDKLLESFKALEARRETASVELRNAGRESDGLAYDEEHRHPVTPARKKAAAQRWASAVRAEKAISNKMRDIVLKIRAIDPARVPWGWQHTR
jgi:hypothetical protein